MAFIFFLTNLKWGSCVQVLETKRWERCVKRFPAKQWGSCVQLPETDQWSGSCSCFCFRQASGCVRIQETLLEELPEAAAGMLSAMLS